VDIATIIGIVAGMGLVIMTILMGGDAGVFIHVPSMMIVFGGSVAATLVNFPLAEMVGVMKVVKKAFQGASTESFDLIGQIVDLSKKARREGLLAIDKELANVEDEFLRSGLEMAVDGTEAETIRTIMETELSYLMERHKKGQGIFNSLGMYAPAFGMIGTLIGLIAMLQKLDDPSQIGGGMAVALITTFYGALIANLIFLPIAGKLKNKSNEEVVLKEMIIEGVLSIQYGEHPKNIQRKLMNFIPPEMREGATEESGD
jgi:chemotaxis protein MotA